MPAESALTDSGRALLGELPSWTQRDPDRMAICHVVAKESDRIMALAAEVRDNFIPVRATALGLPWWEHLLGLAVEPPGQTVDERRATVVTAIGQALPDPSGSRWEEALTRIVGPGWDYDEDSAAFTITVTLPVPAGAEILDTLALLLRDWTPAHLQLIVQSSAGFVLDVSELDQEALAG